MLRRTACIALAAFLTALALAACGRGERVEESKIIGDTLTVYSSLPLTGPLESLARDVVRAEKLAIEEAGGRVGEFRISYVSLDSADPKTGRWHPRRVAANAREAVDDLQTIAYIGELEAGASAISLPILNEGGMLQVSPGDTYAGLTERRGAGEPEKYYPSAKRTFVRTVPTDSEQVAEIVALMQRRGARRVALVDDRQVASTALVDALADRLAAAGVEVVRRERLNADGDVPTDLARHAVEDRIDALFYGGAYNPFAVAVLRSVATAAPRVDLFAPDSVAAAPELPARAGPAARRLVLTAVTPDMTAATENFVRRYRERYGDGPALRAVLGYHAMRLVLEAIERAGAAAVSRPAVIRHALAIAGRPPSAFAPFRISAGVLVPAPSAL